MKRKIMALVISAVLAAGTITGCGEGAGSAGSVSGQAGSTVSASQSAKEENVDKKPREIALITGDADLDRAVYLGIISEEELSEDHGLKGNEAFSIAVKTLDLISPDVSAQFSQKNSIMRISTKSFSRMEGMLLLFKAAQALGGDYIYISDFSSTCFKLSSMGWDAVYGNATVSSDFGEEEFFNLYDTEFAGKEYAVLFAIGRRDLYTGASLFDISDKDLRAKESLSLYEMVRASVRFYDSVPGTRADDFLYVYSGDGKRDFRITVDGEPKGVCQADKKNGEWRIPEQDAREIFGDVNVQAEEGCVSLRTLAETLNISYEPDAIMDAAYFWTNETFEESPAVPLYLTNGNVDQAVDTGGPKVIHTQMISVSDDRALKADPEIITSELVSFAKERASENEGSERLTGFVLPGIDWETKKISTTESDLRNIANWGFNSVRIMLDWQDFFDHDLTEIDLDELNALDKLVATAMKYDIHIDLEFLKMPGRWHTETEDAMGGDYELDLYVNEKQQDKCVKMWKIFAARYKDIPGRTLSFSPLWEASNLNLSSTHEAPEYGPAEIAKTFIKLAKAINEESPDRLLFCEPCSNSNGDEILGREFDPVKKAIEDAGLDNVMFQANFVSQPYVYAEMLPDDPGVNIDLMTHSMFKPEYPVKIYAAKRVITKDGPMTIDGFLPEGTAVTVYVKEASGKVSFSVDGEEAAAEDFGRWQEFTTGSVISGYYPYATSDHLITFTLEKETKEIKIETTGSFEWSGISILLPEEYAVERWYYYSAYDNMLESGENYKKDSEKLLTSEVLISPSSQYLMWLLGDPDNAGEHVTILKEIGFTSDTVLDESTNESISKWGDIMKSHDAGPVIRFEDDEFNLGTSYESELRYYEDLLTVFDTNGFGWYSNDYVFMHGKTYGKLAGLPEDYYAGHADFNVGLLKLLQKHQ